MGNYLFTRVEKVLLTLIIIAMTLPGYSQVPPEYDKVNTSAGIVEMHFFGHGSLMFKVNAFVIYIDPVRSSGNYDFFPKADIILVTHEHGDHLDANLIDSLKKKSTLVFCNENSLSKVRWAMAMKPGDRQEINNIIIEAVPAYNIVNVTGTRTAFPSERSWSGLYSYNRREEVLYCRRYRKHTRNESTEKHRGCISADESSLYHDS